MPAQAWGDCRTFSDAGTILSEVSPLALVGEEITVRGQGVLYDPGKFDNSWHEQMLHSPIAPGKNCQQVTLSYLFLLSQS